jgi:hypothetical protein
VNVAVAAGYGRTDYPTAMSNNESLSWLFALNLQRAAEG